MSTQQPRYPLYKYQPPSPVFLCHWGEYDVYTFERGRIYIAVSGNPPPYETWWCQMSCIPTHSKPSGFARTDWDKNECIRPARQDEFEEFCNAHFNLSL